MTVNIQHVLTSFQGGLGLNLRIMREYYGVQFFEITPKLGSLLGISAQDGVSSVPLRLICDNAITPYVLLAGCWQPEEFAFVQKVSGGIGDFVLVDVGANVGLFSRQCIAKLPNCKKVYCYEPDKSNFGLLTFNLSSFEAVVCKNVALSDTNGQATYFLDPDNCGNYSLNQAAMPTEHKSGMLECVDALEESKLWTTERRPLFYKSDTQGFDEKIATRMDMSFWDGVFGGILEVWQIKKPSYDSERLRIIFDKFPNKCFLTDPNKMISTDELMQFVGSEAGASQDLGFWR